MIRKWPEHFALKRALVELLSDEQEHHDDEIVARLAADFEMTPAMLARTLPSGRPYFANLVDHAKRALTTEKMVIRVRPKVYRILPLGKAWLESLKPRRSQG